jgi:GPH family glycoside/pentoside/hexuronide:cation symporter
MNDFAPSSSTPPSSNKLTFGTKLAYGAGDLGPAITANILAVTLLIFFTSVAGLKPGIAGSILLIGKIWDAINDPIVGVLSDRTRSRWGRRLPWMVFGAIPFGFFFVLQWLVPRFSANAETNQWALFWYYVIVGILFHSFYTAVNLPYTALTPQLTRDYDERTSLNSFRFAFSISGSILSLAMAIVIFSAFKNDPTQQFLVLGIACAVISVPALYWCVLGTLKRVQETEGLVEEPDTSLSYLEQLKIAFTNRPFLYVMGIYLCSWLALQNTVAVIPYFVKNWMGLNDQAYFTILIAVQVTALVMLFIWSGVSARVGKRAVYFMGMSLWIIAEFGLFFLQPGQVGWMYVLGVLAGFGVSTAYLIPWSMIPDVIELDELNTGQRREGIFYGFMVLLQKIAIAFSLFLVGILLQESGFLEKTAGQPEPTQPLSALWAIRWLVGPIPMIILLLGLLLAYFYPITREVHAEILLKLSEKRRTESEPEPLE